MLLIHFKNTRRILCSPFSNVTSIRIVSCEILLIKAFTDYLFKIILFHAILFYFILFYTNKTPTLERYCVQLEHKNQLIFSSKFNEKQPTNRKRCFENGEIFFISTQVKFASE